MGKSNAEVIAIFNEQVNMTADELETWLEDPQSRKAGTGVGIESGRRIIEILRKNPTKKPDAYDEEDMAHIRKVVGYNSRHLAQEDHLKITKTVAELAKTKSTISLKNWGHDPVKVKLQREAEASAENDAHGNGGNDGAGEGASSASVGGGGDDGGAAVKNSDATSPDQERDRERNRDRDRSRSKAHDSDEDADGEVETQASNPSTDSESDTFEDAKTGQKRPPRGPPAGATEHQTARRAGRGHVRAESERSTEIAPAEKSS